MSTSIILVIIHIVATVSCFAFSITDKTWYRTTTLKERIVVYVIAVIPLINLLLLAMMVSGYLMAKAVVGKSRKD